MGGCRLQRFPTSIATGFPGLWIAPPSSTSLPCGTDRNPWHSYRGAPCSPLARRNQWPDVQPFRRRRSHHRTTGGTTSRSCRWSFPTIPAARNGFGSVHLPDESPTFPCPDDLAITVARKSDFLSRFGGLPVSIHRRACGAGSFRFRYIPCGPGGPLRGSDENPLARTSANFPVSPASRPLLPGSVPRDSLAVVTLDSPRETPLLRHPVSRPTSSWNPAASSSVMPPRC